MVNNIIEQIASGENTINTISLKVGEKDNGSLLIGEAYGGWLGREEKNVLLRRKTEKKHSTF